MDRTIDQKFGVVIIENFAKNVRNWVLYWESYCHQPVKFGMDINLFDVILKDIMICLKTAAIWSTNVKFTSSFLMFRTFYL